jgi:hypothetical protein
MPSNVVKIDDEARKNVKIRTDCDNFRSRYMEQQDGVTVKFIAPLFTILEKNRFYLLKNSVKKILPSKFYRRPDYMSKKEYGTTTLWYVLMYINDIPCIEEFNRHEILVPNYMTVLELVRDIVGDDFINLSDLTRTTYESFEKLYTNDKDVPVASEEVVTTEEGAPSMVYYWVKQKYIITLGQETGGFLDLPFEPYPETVFFKTEHAGNHIMNIDYAVIAAPDGKMRRISWRPEDCVDGTGLLGRLLQGMVVEVTYSKKVTYE